MTDKTAPLRIAIHGELTVYTAATVRSDLLLSLDHANELEVDLAQVTEIDSAGIQILAAVRREASARRKTLRFITPSHAVIDTLDLTDLAAYVCNPLRLH